MNGKSIVIKKLEEETLSKVSGGGEKFEAFNQAMSVAGLSAVVAGGLSSVGLLTASFICEHKGIDPKKCSLIQKLAISSAAIAGLGLVTNVIAVPEISGQKADE